MEGKNNLNRYGFWFLVVIYSVGIAGHLYNSTLLLMIMLTPYTLFIGAVLIIYSEVVKRKESIIWFIAFYVVTFIVEVIGVKTRLIFGEYNYGNVLGIKLFDVPLIIGINWVIIVVGAVSAAGRIFNKKFYHLISAGSIATLFDFLLEPIAVKLGYWNWSDNTIPVQNYIAWFVIASIISAFALIKNISVKEQLAESYLYIQLVFFLILNLFL